MIPHQRLQYRNATIQFFFKSFVQGSFSEITTEVIWHSFFLFFFFLIRSSFVAQPGLRLAVILLSNLLRARVVALNLHAWPVSRFSIRGCRCRLGQWHCLSRLLRVYCDKLDENKRKLEVRFFILF